MSDESFIKKISNDSKKRHLFLGGLLFGIIFLFIFFSNNGLLTRIELELEKAEIQEEITEKKAKIEESKDQIIRLKTDSLEIERIAREKYGYVKEGEKIYIMKKKEK